MKSFTEEDIKRTGLPPDVMGLIHDLCYHVNNNLRGTMDERAIENYVGRAQKILSIPKCEKCIGEYGRHSINCPVMEVIMAQKSDVPRCSLVLGDNTICDKPQGHSGLHGRPAPSIEDVEFMMKKLASGGCLCGHFESCDECSQLESARNKRKARDIAIQLAHIFISEKSHSKT